MSRNYAHISLYLLFISFILISMGRVQGQKVDKIKLANGDMITGEIKLLEYGKLTYKTDDAGTLSVNWDKVDYISSPHIFEVEIKSGELYYGSLAFGDEPGTVHVVVGPAFTKLNHMDIVAINPIKTNFFKRLSGSIQFGFGYSKENDMLQINDNANITYRYRKVYSEINIDGQFSVQYDTSRTQKQDYNINTGRFLRKRYYVGGLLGFEQNSGLNLQLRTKLGAAFGRAFIQSNKNDLTSYVALQTTRENYFDSTASTNNLEFVIDLAFRRFLYHTPKSQIYFEVSLIPNLTTWGRIRSDMNINVQQEIIKDLTVNLSLYTNYDNQPTGDATEKLDWGITLSIGYTFN